jgi:hypothetical protein
MHNEGSKYYITLINIYLSEVSDAKPISSFNARKNMDRSPGSIPISLIMHCPQLSFTKEINI